MKAARNNAMHRCNYCLDRKRRHPLHLPPTTMAHHDFWRGFNTAILMIAVLRLCWLINIYICKPAYPSSDFLLISCLGGVAVAVVAFALLHNFLTNVRNYLQQKQQLRKAKGMYAPPS